MLVLPLVLIEIMNNFIIIVFVAALLIGLSKGGFGGPVPVSMLTPLMSLIMPAAQAVGIVLPLLLLGDVFALWIYWKTWDPRYIRLMLPMAVVGIVIGSALLGALASQDMLFRRIIGAFTLSVVIYKFISSWIRSLTYEPRDWHGYFVGWAAGFGSALANVGAPPFTAYMLLQKTNPTIFIGTTTLFFAIVNALKLPGVFITGALTPHQFASILWAAPVIPAGVWIGKRFVKWVNPQVFEWIMLTTLLIMSIFLLVYTPNK